jgi:PAS domain S-box-containing protein
MSLKNKSVVDGSEENFRVLFDENPHPTVLSEIPSGIITHANKRIAAILGLKPEQIIGKTANDLGLLKNRDDLAKLTTLITSQGYVDNVEVEKFFPDGSTGTDSVSMRIVTVDGKPHCLTVIQDITERKQIRQALDESEGRFRKIAEQAPIAMAIVGMDGTIEFINQKAVKVFGYAHEDIPTMERWWVQAYPDEDYRNVVVDDWTGRIQKAIADGTEIVGNEYRVACKDGSFKTMFISGTIVSGKVFVLFDDITAYKQAEEALRKSEERYRRLVETTETGYVILDDKGLVIDANAEYVRLSGHRKIAEILRRSVVEWTADEEKEKNERAVAACMEKGFIRGLEITYVDGSGKRTPVEINATMMETEGKPQILSLCRDITERQRIEEALRDSEKKFSTAFRTSPDSININRLSDGMYLEINEGFTATTGYTPEDVIGRSSLPGDLGLWVNPEDRDRLVAGLRAKGVVVGLEAPFRMKNGKTLIGLMSARIIEVNGEACILSTTRDITERKHTEDVLLKSEQKYRDLANSLPLTIFEMSTNGLLTYVNRTALEWFGYSEAEFSKGINVLELVVEADRRLATENIRRIIESGETSSSEYSLIRKDNTVFPALVASRPIRENGEVLGIRGTLVDITERKETEASLKASETKYRDLANSVPTGIFESDPTGKFTFINTTAREWFGYSEAEIAS